ncbi:tyrosine phosphatase family-domain-containing protein [Mrakia frigida]|uniref:tyrosine phosphatase family-domain-containing protein n=1 Tax=Mrakia frigida TaxID=29902 RepID=UPI003FCC2082
MSLPLLLPPFHLSLLLSSPNESIYRGSLPHPRNLRFLRRLHLRTILSLTPQPLPAETLRWAEKEGIRCVWVEVGTAGEESLGSALKEGVKEGLATLLDSRNLPLYVHCGDGGVNTSALMGALRRMQGWSSESILNEALRFDPTPSSPNPALLPFITSFALPPLLFPSPTQPSPLSSSSSCSSSTTTPPTTTPPTNPPLPTWILPPPPPPPPPPSRKESSKPQQPPPPPFTTSASSSGTTTPTTTDTTNPNPTPPNPPHSHPLSRVSTHESTFTPTASSSSRPLSRVQSRTSASTAALLLSPSIPNDSLSSHFDETPTANTPTPAGGSSTPKRPRTPSVVLHPPSAEAVVRFRDLDFHNPRSPSGSDGGVLVPLQHT